MPNKSKDDSDLFSEFRSASRLMNFLSEKPDKIIDRSQFLNPQEQGGNDTYQFDDENVDLFEKLLQHKCITRTQHKIVFNNIELN